MVDCRSNCNFKGVNATEKNGVAFGSANRETTKQVIDFEKVIATFER